MHELLSQKEPALVIVRGRRRIGKSTLIGNVLRDEDIYFEADRTAPPVQQQNLASVIAHRFGGFDGAVYKDWKTLLKALNARTTERFTLCLDEFPYLVEGSPELPSVVQGLLDDQKDPLRYSLILCGSSQQMMYDLTHDESSPLYGRDDADFNMKPISLPYLAEALELDAVDAVENYAVWGGAPRYWKLRESSQGLRQAIDTHILSDLGALYEEPSRLFRDDVKDTVKTSTIMSVVGAGVHRLSEISSRLGEPATNLARPLAKLVNIGFLEKETPFGESPKDSKRNLYQIGDPFLGFYYKFVPANRSFIKLRRMAPVYAALEKDLPSHFGYWWEHLCRDAVTGNVLDGITFGPARRWWGKVLLDGEKAPRDVEIDVVAESLDHKTLLLGECKWTSGENGRLLTHQLEKIAGALPFARGKHVLIKLFTKTRPDDDQGNTLLPEDVMRMGPSPESSANLGL